MLNRLQEETGVGDTYGNAWLVIEFLAEQSDSVFAFDDDVAQRPVIQTYGYTLSSAPFVRHGAALCLVHGVIGIVTAEDKQLL